MNRSILVVYTKPIEGREAEFNDWYSDVHLPEVVKLNGFVAARRYRFVPDDDGTESPALPYLALYDVEPGRLEEARAALAAALKSSRCAMKEGRAPELMPSDSLHAERSVLWFEELASAGGGSIGMQSAHALDFT